MLKNIFLVLISIVSILLGLLGVTDIPIIGATLFFLFWLAVQWHNRGAGYGPTYKV